MIKFVQPYQHYSLENLATEILQAIPQADEDCSEILPKIISETAKVMQLEEERLVNPDFATISLRSNFGRMLLVRVMCGAQIQAQQIAETLRLDVKTLPARIREFEHYKELVIGVGYLPKKHRSLEEISVPPRDEALQVEAKGGEMERIIKIGSANGSGSVGESNQYLGDQTSAPLHPPLSHPPTRTREDIKAKLEMELIRGNAVYAQFGRAEDVLIEIANAYDVKPEEVKGNPLKESAMEAAIAIAYCLVQRENIPVINVWQLLDTDRDAIEEYVRIGELILGESSRDNKETSGKKKK